MCHIFSKLKGFLVQPRKVPWCPIRTQLVHLGAIRPFIGKYCLSRFSAQFTHLGVKLHIFEACPKPWHLQHSFIVCLPTNTTILTEILCDLIHFIDVKAWKGVDHTEWHGIASFTTFFFHCNTSDCKTIIS